MADESPVTIEDLRAIVPDLEGLKEEIFWYETRNWDGPDDPFRFNVELSRNYSGDGDEEAAD